MEIDRRQSKVAADLQLETIQMMTTELSIGRELSSMQTG